MEPNLLKRKIEDIESDFESDEEEWVDLGDGRINELKITISVPGHQPVAVDTKTTIKTENNVLLKIKDKKLRQSCIKVLFSCIISNFLKEKQSLLRISSDSELILKLNYRKLDFKVLSRHKNVIYAVCLCEIRPMYCQFCDMHKNPDCKILGCTGKILKRIENDCFLLVADRKFGFSDITSMLPFNPSRQQYKYHIKLISWLYSSGQAAKKEPLTMPNSLKAFKDHPFYCLQKSLNYNQILMIPRGKERSLSIGIFKKDLVYPSNLIRELYSERELLRMGLEIKQGEECLKVGANRKLYGEWQCVALQRPRLENGRIPRDSYGSIELLHRNMLPLGCIVVDGSWQSTCQFLNLEYVKVLKGFRGKIPIFGDITVKEEDYPVLMEVHQQMEEVQNEEAKFEREIVVYTRWKQLISGYLLKKRLEADYL